MTTTTTQPPPRQQLAPAPPLAPPALNEPVHILGARLRPRVPIYQKRACGTLLYGVVHDHFRRLITEATGFPNLKPSKLEALQGLGVSFVEVENPET